MMSDRERGDLAADQSARQAGELADAQAEAGSIQIGQVGILENGEPVGEMLGIPFRMVAPGVLEWSADAERQGDEG